MTEQQTQKSRRGCLFYGLLTMALIFLGVLAGVYFGTRKAVRYAIESYTTNAPTSIPALQIPPGDRRSIASNLLERFEAAANKQGPAEITVNEQELNVVISQAPDLKPFHGSVYLEPQGSELKAHISLPLDQFKPWQEFAHRMGGTNYAGRYLNGLAYANLTLTNGLLKVVPRKMVVGAKTLPEDFIEKFPWDTLTQPINENADFRSALQQVESISVEDSKVRVQFKQ